MLYDSNGFERCLYYKNGSHIDVKVDDLRDHIIDCGKLYVRSLVSQRFIE